MSERALAVPTVRLFGLEVSTLDTPATIEWLVRAAAGEGDRPRLATYLNPHTVLQARADPRFAAELARLDLRYPDGVGLVWAARWLRRPVAERVTASDFLPGFCAAAARAGVSLFLLGGAAGVAERAAERLSAAAPGLRVAGTHHGYLEGAEAERRVAERVRESGADACVVAMGSPRQERFVLEHGEASGASLLWAVGGALDFHAGLKRRAPRPLQRLGLEWAFRLALEPRRLARRYLIGNAAFAWATLRERRGD